MHFIIREYQPTPQTNRESAIEWRNAFIFMIITIIIMAEVRSNSEYGPLGRNNENGRKGTQVVPVVAS